MILVTGGARSGKSEFAENLALKSSDEDIIYIATSIPFDEGMKERIRLHQKRRSKRWKTIESYRKIGNIIEENNKSIILIDCVTVMITNLMMDLEGDLRGNDDDLSQEKKDMIKENIISEFEGIINACNKNKGSNVVLVTNELGMGIVPMGEFTRRFVDIHGEVNQLLAKNSDEVYFVVSSIPIKIK